MLTYPWLQYKLRPTYIQWSHKIYPPPVSGNPETDMSNNPFDIIIKIQLPGIAQYLNNAIIFSLLGKAESQTKEGKDNNKESHHI